MLYRPEHVDSIFRSQHVKIVKAIIAHFSRSDHAHHLLTEERAKQGVRFRLQKLSKIRFGNIYWSSISVVDSLPIISSLAEAGRIEFKVLPCKANF